MTLHSNAGLLDNLINKPKVHIARTPKETLMPKIKSILVLSATALLMSTTPSLAQSYGSGSSASSLPQTSQPRAVRKVTKTLSKAEKRQMAAQEQKQRLEAQLAEKEKAAQSYGSGTKPAETSYGSGTTKTADPSYGSGTTKSADPSYGSGTKPADASYGSGTKDAMKDKGDHMMKKEDVMMKEDAMMKDKASSYGSGTQAPAYGSGNAAPASSGIPLNCPTGTKGQPDGTCMITSGSFPLG